MNDPIATGLVRTKGGTVVHRAECARIQHGVTSTATRWEWAEGRPVAEVRQALGMVGSRLCQICKPLETGA